MGDRDFLKWVVLRLGAFGRGRCLSDTGRRSTRSHVPGWQVLQMLGHFSARPGPRASDPADVTTSSPSTFPSSSKSGDQQGLLTTRAQQRREPILTMFLNNNDHNHNDNSSTSPLLRAKCFVPCTLSKRFEHLISFEPHSTQGGMLYYCSSHRTDVEPEAHRGCDLTEAP